QHSDDGMVLNLQPQVVVAGADGAPRIIPFKTCTASVVVKPGATVTFDGFPGADADFYRVFEGAQESTGDAISNVAIAAVVDYSQAVQQQAQPGAAQPQTPGQPAPVPQPVRIQVQPSQQSSTLIDVQTTQ
ncbi:MAG TPA: hypothetical protein VG733_11135, partial [Chthoniobacteraceae bacterium]|nr:hypothetical protein [Chthoniobacteraceae bacterium]